MVLPTVTASPNHKPRTRRREESRICNDAMHDSRWEEELGAREWGQRTVDCRLSTVDDVVVTP
jgi:hypothetical protein